MSERTYTAKVVSASKELTPKEKLMLTDTTNAVRLDRATANGQHITIKPKEYAVIGIHNEHSKDLDYENYIVIDEDGTKYTTGSKSFFTSFTDIFEAMEGSDEEWALDVYQAESKNREGQHFITCSII